MKRLLLVLVGWTVAASMATAAFGSTPARVGIPGCGLGSGTWIVPVDSTITLFGGGWSDKNRGLTQAFLNAVVTDASIDGVPIPDADRYFDQPHRIGDSWFTFWLDPTGITLLNPGDTMTVTFDQKLSHQLVDPTARTAEGKIVHYEPGVSLWGGLLSCTITAA